MLPPRPAQKALDTATYQCDPVGYAEHVLNVTWWEKQREIARALCTPPGRVLAKTGHKVGKTHLAGGLVNWWYDSFNPSIVLTTAPTDRQVKDLLWKEVRVQRRGRPGLQPKAPRLEDSPDHFAHGFTARDGESFQGHHSAHTLIIFDEAVGIAPIFWESAESMMNEGSAWLAIFNPTDVSSQAYIEEQRGGWTVVSLSVLDHPNIVAELAGNPPPYPSAMRLSRIDALIAKWCTPVSDTVVVTDIEWPPSSGIFLRPGPIAEARLLGRWPSKATNTVWSEAAFSYASTTPIQEHDGTVEIGCDVARFGDDSTAIHVRRGMTSLHHESANGWSTAQTAARLKTLAQQYAVVSGQPATSVLVKIDDDGVGGGVVDQADGYAFAGVSSASRAFDREGYPNRRSELWFSVAQRATEKRLDITMLSREAILDLKRQALAPTWKLDGQGRRVVESKDETKKRIKRSPDDMDALNLAYAPVIRSTDLITFV